ncbi:MAG: hypothetical protein FJX72_18545, partial [Armatimonadetes bacterium]|nr:hypothetical protein [Armatimonadota bacterium]
MPHAVVGLDDLEVAAPIGAFDQQELPRIGRVGPDGDSRVCPAVGDTLGNPQVRGYGDIPEGGDRREQERLLRAGPERAACKPCVGGPTLIAHRAGERVEMQRRSIADGVSRPDDGSQRYDKRGARARVMEEHVRASDPMCIRLRRSIGRYLQPVSGLSRAIMGCRVAGMGG